MEFSNIILFLILIVIIIGFSMYYKDLKSSSLQQEETVVSVST